MYMWDVPKSSPLMQVPVMCGMRRIAELILTMPIECDTVYVYTIHSVNDDSEWQHLMLESKLHHSASDHTKN